MSAVPPGWTLTTIGALGRYLNGRAFKKEEWATSGRPIIRIQNLTGSGAAFNYFQGDVEDRYVVRPGDLLVSWAATLGAYFWSGPEAVLNQHIFKVNSHIDVRFHKYLLDYKLDELMRHTHGSGMVHITRGRFDSVPVAIPPLEEQRRIVDILEDHLSRLDAAQAYLRASQRHLESLTSSWFRGSGLMSAPRSTLSQLLRSPLANGRSVPTRDGGFPVLRLTALAGERVRLSERKGGAWDEGSARPFLVERGDVLVSRGNGSLRLVARGALVAEDPDPVAFPDTMIRVRPRPEAISPDYLVLVWNSRLVRQQIEAIARTTAGIYKVNQRQLGQIELPVVPIDVQMRLLRDADELNVERGRMIDAVERAGAHTEALRRALLVAAFAGRLTGRSSDMDRVEELAGV